MLPSRPNLRIHFVKRIGEFIWIYEPEKTIRLEIEMKFKKIKIIICWLLLFIQLFSKWIDFEASEPQTYQNSMNSSNIKKNLILIFQHTRWREWIHLMERISTICLAWSQLILQIYRYRICNCSICSAYDHQSPSYLAIILYQQCNTQLSSVS